MFFIGAYWRESYRQAVVAVSAVNNVSCEQ